jgi:hypothetical protein
MRRSILDIAFVKKNITPFRISIALSRAPIGLQPLGGTQAKAWAKFPRPFGPPTRRYAKAERPFRASGIPKIEADNPENGTTEGKAPSCDGLIDIS